MSAWSQTVPAGTTDAWDPLLVNIIGGNLGPNYFQNTNTDITNALTVLSKSALRGVPDYTNPLYSNPAQWYPDPALAAGGQTYNVFNLDPFVWFIHEKLGITAYAFSLDDDIGNVNAGGATDLAISVGGLNGLPNKDPYTNESNWGVLPTGATINAVNSSELGGLSNPQVVQQIIPFNYNQDKPGTLVNGPGVPMGTTVQFVQIPPVLTQSTMTLSNPLTSSSPGDMYAFFGPLTFTGTVLGSGQADDTIILNSPDAYTTLMKLGPLGSIQVTGEGIDPTKTVTIKQLTEDAQTGVITLELTGNLDPTLVTQPGGFYAYTFGSPVVGLVRDAGFEWADVRGPRRQVQPRDAAYPEHGGLDLHRWPQVVVRRHRIWQYQHLHQRESAAPPGPPGRFHPGRQQHQPDRHPGQWGVHAVARCSPVGPRPNLRSR